jgi:putative heme transporter
MPTRKPATPEGELPVGIRVAGAWAWRILVIAGVIAVLIFLVVQLRLIVIPFLVAILLAALLVPFSQWLQRHRWPKWLAIALSEIGLIAIVAGLVVLVVTQIVDGFPALQTQTLERIDDLRAWLLTSPFHLTDSQINDYYEQAIVAIKNDSQFYISGVLSFGSSFGHFLAGVLLALFSTLFILIDGRGIFDWFVRLFPRAARPAVHGAGEAGWITLTNFVKVQIFVAAVDATGIGLGAFFLQLPLVIPIAVAVFLGSFIPVVGAVLTGFIAVFVALVFSGPIAAVIMLGVVILVQQVEGHVLQPLIVGSIVKVHPLAVVLAVATGGFIGGIPGALFAVPVVAVLNVVVSYIAEGEWRTHPHPQLKDVVKND